MKYVPSTTRNEKVCLEAQVCGVAEVSTIDHNLTSFEYVSIIEAISAPAAAERRDYNRLEFLGDSILKFCAVLQVLAWHPNWPEGYLHSEKKRLVSNSTLTKAALKVRLDHFILQHDERSQADDRACARAGHSQLPRARRSMRTLEVVCGAAALRPLTQPKGLA